MRGLRIGLLQEGFGQEPWEDLGLPGSEVAVDAAVRAAAAELAKAGAIVSEVSVPMHQDGVRIFYGFYAEGAAQFMINGNFTGTNWLGYYNRPLAEFHGAALKERPNELSPAFKGILLLGEHLRRTTFGRYYAIGQNLRPRLVAAYDRALAEHDVLVLPTTPIRATPIPPDECGVAERIAFAMRMIGNTCQFGVTGASGHQRAVRHAGRSAYRAASCRPPPRREHRPACRRLGRADRRLAQPLGALGRTIHAHGTFPWVPVALGRGRPGPASPF